MILPEYLSRHFFQVSHFKWNLTSRSCFLDRAVFPYYGIRHKQLDSEFICFSLESINRIQCFRFQEWSIYTWMQYCVPKFVSADKTLHGVVQPVIDMYKGHAFVTTKKTERFAQISF